jgi:hypothetical protein
MEWWGYSRDHGWVVLDRSIRCNQRRGELIFLRCRDAAVFTDSYDNWKEPAYFFAPKRLSMLRMSERSQVEEELSQWKRQWPEWQANLHERVQLMELEARRDRHFEFIGKDNPGMRAARAYRPRRITHCWRCREGLDNAVQRECNGCDGIVCACGACLCGYVS